MGVLDSINGPDYLQAISGFGSLAPVEGGWGQVGNPGSLPNFGNSVSLLDPNKLNFMDKAGLALGGLQTLGSLFASLKSLSLANKQFNFQKQFATTNLANSVKSYNTALADRARARAAMEGQSQADAQAYVDQNKMTGI